jgi:hypothetical protein
VRTILLSKDGAKFNDIILISVRKEAAPGILPHCAS